MPMKVQSFYVYSLPFFSVEQGRKFPIHLDYRLTPKLAGFKNCRFFISRGENLLIIRSNNLRRYQTKTSL